MPLAPIEPRLQYSKKIAAICARATAPQSHEPLAARAAVDTALKWQQQRAQRAAKVPRKCGAHVGEIFAEQLEDAALPVKPGGQVVDLDPLPHRQDGRELVLGLACTSSKADQSVLELARRGRSVHDSYLLMH